MEPHSRPCSSHGSTLRLPQALVLLLQTALAGPSSDHRVTQTDSNLGLWPAIKNAAYRLISLVNPFLVSNGRWTLTFVGMVKLAAICGIGSALWLWSKRNDKGKAATSSAETQHADAVGKRAPGHRRQICQIT